MGPDPTFEVEVDPDATPGSRLVVGTAAPAMVGLTAVDYLVDQRGAEQVGHVTVDGYPSMAPFSDGIARPHTRLYDVPGDDLSVLVGELFVPVPAAEAYADGLLSWVESAGVTDLTLLSGIPYPHAPEDHDVYYVATEAYRDRHLAETEVRSLAGGFLDGLAGELMSRSVSGSAPPVGALVTPSHPPGPDLEATLLFVEALESILGVEVDTGELKQLSAEVRKRYEEMAKRLEAMSEGGSMDSRDYPEDRAYM